MTNINETPNTATATPPAPKLTRMRLAYKLEGQPPVEVTPHNRSLIAWDETRGVRKWPTMRESPFLFQTFIIWHHLNRTGIYKGDFTTFRDECEHTEALDDEEPVDPTQPDPISG